MAMLVLDEEAVRAALRREELLPAMERALADLSAGRVVQPVRTMLPVAEHGGFLGLMPAYVRAATGEALGVKLVTLYPGNRDVPAHHAVVVLFKPETGELLATMDGRLITEERTAAVSAVATRYLARPEAAVLAVLGAGVQARSHVRTLPLVRAFREVRVWSPHRAAAFAAELGEYGVRAAESAEAAVRGADVVVTATSSRTPVLRGEWLAPGAHVNAVGAPRPDWRELDDEVLRRARLYVDSRAAAIEESGDVRASLEAGGEIAGELGEVVAGKAAGRQSADEITVFKSVGLAVEDVAAAELVYRKILASKEA
jgi:ornithine cyclodeaminase/alanine dehydrogenase-like protein (mu-crystallin family)